MALIACDECDAQISSKASSCPHCGNPLGKAPPSAASLRMSTPKKKSNPLIKGFVVACLALTAFVIYEGSATHSSPASSDASAASEQHSNDSAATPAAPCVNGHMFQGHVVCDDDVTSNQSTQAAAADAAASAAAAASVASRKDLDLRALPGWPQEQPQTVSLSKMYDDYEANEVAADNVYRGHLLAATGRIAFIKKNLMDETELGLDVDGHMIGIDAVLNPSYVPIAAGLSKGQTATVICVGAGKMISPNLKNCAIGVVDGEPIKQPSPT